MSLLTYFDRLKRMDNLIRSKATGSPKEFAQKLKISERLLYDYLGYMREMGANIEFDVYRRSYIYNPPVYFEFGYFPESISEEEVKEINGGSFCQVVYNSII